jgi:hypothetical protein
MTTTQFPSLVVLRSGRVAYIDADRKATLETCSWLVQVPTASLYPPEAEWYPDSPSDVYTELDCGAPVFAKDGDLDHTFCTNGHVRLAYGSPAQQAEERAEAEVLYMASQNPNLAARLDAGEPWQSVMFS